MNGYNYQAFSSQDYDFENSDGPQVGVKAPDFTLTTADGASRRLLDFEGGFLVLETGSITCPLFQSRRPIMETLTAAYGVSTAVLYVREAHPGANIQSHRTMDDKTACAARLKNEDGEGRLILIDGLEGQAHAAYGSMPNAVFIINKNGCVVFRSDWNNPVATRKAVAALVAGKSVTAKSYFKPATPRTLIRTMRKAGEGSLPDFLRSLPVLFWKNIIKRNLRLLFNRPIAASGDTQC